MGEIFSWTVVLSVYGDFLRFNFVFMSLKSEVLIVVLIMVFSTVIAQFRRDQYLSKPESISQIKETANLWNHALESEILNGITNQEVGFKRRMANDKKNSQLFSSTTSNKKTHGDLKLNYDLLKSVLVTTSSKDIKPLGLNSKPIESQTLSYDYEIPLSTSKRGIWGSNSHGLDSGMIGIAAIDMGHGFI